MKKNENENEKWVDLSQGDYLQNNSCPYCGEFFTPKCTYHEYTRKCKCGKKFKYWACPYVVISCKKSDIPDDYDD